MLANMFMRTETFYVPNRILWQDWEKFISGGQKLDDTSVPPYVKFRDLFNSLFLTLVQKLESSSEVSYTTEWLNGIDSSGVYIQGSTSGSILVYTFNPSEMKYAELHRDIFDYDYIIPNSDGSTYYLFKDVTCYRLDVLISRIQYIRDLYVTLAKNYGIYDLMLDSLAALDSMISYMSTLEVSETLYESVGNLSHLDSLAQLLPLKGYYPMFDVLTSYSYEAVVSGASLGSSYMDSIRPILKNLLPNGQRLYCLSEYHAQIFQYLYDFMRPFIGLGSNLDMLGYSCISMVDMYANLYSNLLTSSFVQGSGYWSGAVYSYYLFNGLHFNDNDFLTIFPLRALYAIWYNYYRDQILEADVLEPVTESAITNVEMIQLLSPRRRCWSKDAFTTALDNTGTGSVVVPVSDSIRRTTSVIKSFDTLTANTADTASAKLEDIDVVAYTLTSGETIKLPSRYLSQIATGVDSDKSHAGFSLDVMKRAERVQKWIQKALIYGNRPQDFLFTHFGVRSSDARLQLPEFLSSDSKICRLDTLINNTTTAESVAGDKTANAYGYTDGSNLNRFCEEHGFIITLFSVMPDTDYGYGVSRSLHRLSKFDYAFPEFATLGMDGILNYELCHSPLGIEVSLGDNKYIQPLSQVVFGYQGRYYDYKSKQNEIHGDLRDTLKMYTFAREFNPYDEDGMPLLNKYFVHCRPRLDMFVSDYPLDDQFRFDIHHSQSVERCLPVPSQYL